MIDISELPSWCLLHVLEKLSPEKIADIAPANNDIAEVCLSQSLWENKYHQFFKEPEFKISKSPMNIDWFTSYSKRHAVSFNIEHHKPKAKSFKGTNITQIHNFSNSLAFCSQDSLSILAFDYLENGCEYETIKTIPISVNDFLYVDNNTIVTVNNSVLSIINIKTGEIKEFLNSVGKNPLMHAINSTSFAVVTDRRGYIFSKDDITFPKTTFSHIGDPIALASSGNQLYIATSTDLSCHNISNPKGTIMWNIATEEGTTVKQCSFNVKKGLAIFGNKIVKLLSGRIISTIEMNSQVISSAILNNGIAVLGTTDGVYYYDINHQKELGSQKFGDEENIKYIFHNNLNDKVVIGGDYNVHIVIPEIKDGNFTITEARAPLKCGSVRMRMVDNYGILRQIIFDGERIITNMGDFVRVYDFYNGKITDIEQN